jgi:hypothetical protein
MITSDNTMPTMFAYPPVRKNKDQLGKAPPGGNAHIAVSVWMQEEIFHN